MNGHGRGCGFFHQLIRGQITCWLYDSEGKRDDGPSWIKTDQCTTSSSSSFSLWVTLKSISCTLILHEQIKIGCVFKHFVIFVGHIKKIYTWSSHQGSLAKRNGMAQYVCHFTGKALQFPYHMGTGAFRGAIKSQSLVSLVTEKLTSVEKLEATY